MVVVVLNQFLSLFTQTLVNFLLPKSAGKLARKSLQMSNVHPFITFITTTLAPVNDSKTSCDFLRFD